MNETAVEQKEYRDVGSILASLDWMLNVDGDRVRIKYGDFLREKELASTTPERRDAFDRRTFELGDAIMIDLKISEIRNHISASFESNGRDEWPYLDKCDKLFDGARELDPECILEIFALAEKEIASGNCEKYPSCLCILNDMEIIERVCYSELSESSGVSDGDVALRKETGECPDGTKLKTAIKMVEVGKLRDAMAAACAKIEEMQKVALEDGGREAIGTVTNILLEGKREYDTQELIFSDALKAIEAAMASIVGSGKDSDKEALHRARLDMLMAEVRLAIEQGKTNRLGLVALYAATNCIVCARSKSKSCWKMMGGYDLNKELNVTLAADVGERLRFIGQELCGDVDAASRSSIQQSFLDAITVGGYVVSELVDMFALGIRKLLDAKPRAAHGEDECAAVDCSAWLARASAMLRIVHGYIDDNRIGGIEMCAKIVRLIIFAVSSYMLEPMMYDLLRAFAQHTHQICGATKIYGPSDTLDFSMVNVGGAIYEMAVKNIDAIFDCVGTKVGRSVAVCLINWFDGLNWSRGSNGESRVEQGGIYLGMAAKSWHKHSASA
ncbi:MAG: hypothetical protein LBI39_01260 [Puniceicoccales bacterium]|nr:hypothetical protein [Puniceicoccales bacterium]